MSEREERAMRRLDGDTGARCAGSGRQVVRLNVEIATGRAKSAR